MLENVGVMKPNMKIYSNKFMTSNINFKEGRKA